MLPLTVAANYIQYSGERIEGSIEMLPQEEKKRASLMEGFWSDVKNVVHKEEDLVSESRALRSHTCAHSDTCSSHRGPHAYTHMEGVSADSLSWKIEGERGMETERKRDTEEGRGFGEEQGGGRSCGM